MVVLSHLPGSQPVLGCEGSQRESLQPLGEAERGGRKLPAGGFPRSALNQGGTPQPESSLRKVGMEQGPW